VTAINTAPSGGGDRGRAAFGPASNAVLGMSNTIARLLPGGAGLKVSTDSSNATAAIVPDHSNRLGTSFSGTDTSIPIAIGSGNQVSTPAFVNAPMGDHRQAPGSPTIDAGLDDPANGTFDVEGDQRSVGPTDADGSVDASGATTYWFEHGPTTAYAAPPRAPARAPAPAPSRPRRSWTTSGRGPRIRYRLVAVNGGGVSRGEDRTFTKALSPQPATASMIRTSTTLFAGVRLVSTRLSFSGRVVALKLSCPAGTVGRCSGRTKLTARRRTASGGVRSVTLGRAPFSIASGAKARVRVRVSRAGRRLLKRVRRLRAKSTNAARDGAGTSKRTVTIRRRRR
jgi:hypothetical protein